MSLLFLVFVISSILTLGSGCYLAYRIQQRSMKNFYENEILPKIQPTEFNAEPIAREISHLAGRNIVLEEQLRSLPHKILESLRGSMANMRGELGEYIQLLRLKADYDIIIPLGDIVDYIGIKFPSTDDGDDGSIDFIEVKTNNSRLSPAQKKFKSLILNKYIGFKQVTVKLNDINKELN